MKNQCKKYYVNLCERKKQKDLFLPTFINQKKLI